MCRPCSTFKSEHLFPRCCECSPVMEKPTVHEQTMSYTDGLGTERKTQGGICHVLEAPTVFLPDNRSEPCETRSSHSVSTNTLRLAGDKHLAARRCCRATPPLLFSLSFNAFTFVCSSSRATPRVLPLLSFFLTLRSASRRAHILYILHIMI